MNDAVHSAPPSHYVHHARVINALAGEALNLKHRDESIENTRAKVGVGLSLQAAELAGKAMLRAFGLTVEEIKKSHRHHNLLELFDDVEEHIRTTRKYFTDHFAQGAYAYPRNYFYPDQEKWTGPKPTHALYYMVEDIIEVADGLINSLEEPL